MAKQIMCEIIAHKDIPATHINVDKIHGNNLCCDCYHWAIPTSGITNSWDIKDWEEHQKKSKEAFENCPERKRNEKNKMKEN